MSSSSIFKQIVIIHGGNDLPKDIAEQLFERKPKEAVAMDVSLRCASNKPKTLVEEYSTSETLVVFIIQTIENSLPTEEGSALIRYLKRKSHASDLLKDKFQYCVLGVGDSNLLLDRQTTTAKDCNQVAQQLDSRLESLGGTRFMDLCIADERTGLQEVEPWIQNFWNVVLEQHK